MKLEDLRVLHLGKFWPIRGGVEKVMLDLTEGISSLGIRCDMLCAASSGPSRTIRLNESGEVRAVRSLRKAAATMLSPEMIASLRKVCGGYDVIHVHHPDPMACVALLFSGFKGKVVLHWHSDILKQKRLLKLYAPLQRRLLERADLLVCTTPDYLYSSPWLSSHLHKGTSLPIGVDPIPECSPEEIDAVRSRFPGKKIIFSLGRLVPYKGYRYLIDATRYLPDDYVVLIGGNGPLRRELQEQIDTDSLGDRVALLGGIPAEELPAYYRAADIFCLPSVQKTEAFGIVQIEAMSCGKPVVATRIPGSGTGWVNAHGVSGLNVDVCAPKALAEAFLAIMEDTEVYASFSEGARARYEALFTKKHMVENCLELYSGLWNKKQIQ